MIITKIIGNGYSRLFVSLRTWYLRSAVWLQAAFIVHWFMEIIDNSNILLWTEPNIKILNRSYLLNHLKLFICPIRDIIQYNTKSMVCNILEWSAVTKIDKATTGYWTSSIRSTNKGTRRARQSYPWFPISHAFFYQVFKRSNQTFLYLINTMNSFL